MASGVGRPSLLEGIKALSDSKSKHGDGLQLNSQDGAASSATPNFTGKGIHDRVNSLDEFCPLSFAIAHDESISNQVLCERRKVSSSSRAKDSEFDRRIKSDKAPDLVSDRFERVEQCILGYSLLAQKNRTKYKNVQNEYDTILKKLECLRSQRDTILDGNQTGEQNSIGISLDTTGDTECVDQAAQTESGGLESAVQHCVDCCVKDAETSALRKRIADVENSLEHLQKHVSLAHEEHSSQLLRMKRSKKALEEQWKEKLLAVQGELFQREKRFDLEKQEFLQTKETLLRSLRTAEGQVKTLSRENEDLRSVAKSHAEEASKQMQKVVSAESELRSVQEAAAQLRLELQTQAEENQNRRREEAEISSQRQRMLEAEIESFKQERRSLTKTWMKKEAEHASNLLSKDALLDSFKANSMALQSQKKDLLEKLEDTRAELATSFAQLRQAEEDLNVNKEDWRLKKQELLMSNEKLQMTIEDTLCGYLRRSIDQRVFGSKFSAMTELRNCTAMSGEAYGLRIDGASGIQFLPTLGDSGLDMKYLMPSDTRAPGLVEQTENPVSINSDSHSEVTVFSADERSIALLTGTNRTGVQPKEENVFQDTLCALSQQTNIVRAVLLDICEDREALLEASLVDLAWHVSHTFQQISDKMKSLDEEFESLYFSTHSKREKLQSDVGRQSKQIRELEDKLRKAEKAANDEKERLHESLKKVIEGLKEERKRLNVELAESARLVREKDLDIENLRREMSFVSKQRETQSETNKKLTKKLQELDRLTATLRKANESAEKRINELTKLRGRLTSTMSACASLLGLAMEDHPDCESLHKKLPQSIEKLLGQVKESERYVKKIRSEYEKQEALLKLGISELESALAKHVQDLSCSQKEAARLRKVLGKLGDVYGICSRNIGTDEDFEESMVNVAAVHVQELKARAHDLQMLNSKLASMNCHLERQREVAMMSAEELATWKLVHKSTASELEQINKLQQEKLDSSTDGLLHQQAELDTLRQRLTTKEQQLEQIVECLRDLQGDLASAGAKEVAVHDGFIVDEILSIAAEMKKESRELKELRRSKKGRDEYIASITDRLGFVTEDNIQLKQKACQLSYELSSLSRILEEITHADGWTVEAATFIHQHQLSSTSNFYETSLVFAHRLYEIIRSFRLINDSWKERERMYAEDCTPENVYWSGEQKLPQHSSCPVFVNEGGKSDESETSSPGRASLTSSEIEEDSLESELESLKSRQNVLEESLQMMTEDARAKQRRWMNCYNILLENNQALSGDLMQLDRKDIVAEMRIVNAECSEMGQNQLEREVEQCLQDDINASESVSFTDLDFISQDGWLETNNFLVCSSYESQRKKTDNSHLDDTQPGSASAPPTEESKISLRTNTSSCIQCVAQRESLRTALHLLTSIKNSLQRHMGKIDKVERSCGDLASVIVALDGVLNEDPLESPGSPRQLEDIGTNTEFSPFHIVQGGVELQDASSQTDILRVHRGTTAKEEGYRQGEEEEETTDFPDKSSEVPWQLEEARAIIGSMRNTLDSARSKRETLLMNMDTFKIAVGELQRYFEKSSEESGDFHAGEQAALMQEKVRQLEQEVANANASLTRSEADLKVSQQMTEKFKTAADTQTSDNLLMRRRIAQLETQLRSSGISNQRPDFYSSESSVCSTTDIVGDSTSSEPATSESSGKMNHVDGHVSSFYSEADRLKNQLQRYKDAEKEILKTLTQRDLVKSNEAGSPLPNLKECLFSVLDMCDVYQRRCEALEDQKQVLEEAEARLKATVEELRVEQQATQLEKYQHIGELEARNQESQSLADLLSVDSSFEAMKMSINNLLSKADRLASTNSFELEATASRKAIKELEKEVETWKADYGELLAQSAKTLKDVATAVGLDVVSDPLEESEVITQAEDLFDKVEAARRNESMLLERVKMTMEELAVFKNAASSNLRGTSFLHSMPAVGQRHDDSASPMSSASLTMEALEAAVQTMAKVVLDASSQCEPFIDAESQTEIHTFSRLQQTMDILTTHREVQTGAGNASSQCEPAKDAGSQTEVKTSSRFQQTIDLFTTHREAQTGADLMNASVQTSSNSQSQEAQTESQLASPQVNSEIKEKEPMSGQKLDGGAQLLHNIVVEGTTESDNRSTTSQGTQCENAALADCGVQTMCAEDVKVSTAMQTDDLNPAIYNEPARSPSEVNRRARMLKQGSSVLDLSDELGNMDALETVLWDEVHRREDELNENYRLNTLYSAALERAELVIIELRKTVTEKTRDLNNLLSAQDAKQQEVANREEYLQTTNTMLEAKNLQLVKMYERISFLESKISTLIEDKNRSKSTTAQLLQTLNDQVVRANRHRENFEFHHPPEDGRALGVPEERPRPGDVHPSLTKEAVPERPEDQEKEVPQQGFMVSDKVSSDHSGGSHKNKSGTRTLVAVKETEQNPATERSVPISLKVASQRPMATPTVSFKTTPESSDEKTASILTHRPEEDSECISDNQTLVKSAAGSMSMKTRPFGTPHPPSDAEHGRNGGQVTRGRRRQRTTLARNSSYRIS